jgi:hypothetical protein
MKKENINLLFRLKATKQWCAFCQVKKGLLPLVNVVVTLLPRNNILKNLILFFNKEEANVFTRN